MYDDGDGTWPKRRITSYATKGYPTIGVGHLITAGERDRFRKYLNNQEMPEKEILALLRYDIGRFERAIRPKIKTEITQSMWDALILQAFNTGANTRAIRTAVDRINAKDWRGAQAAIASGAKTSKGKVKEALVRRRAEESSLFLQDGLPEFAQRALNRSRSALSRGQKRYFRKMSRYRKRQLILGIGAASFASIMVLALIARSRA